MRTKEDTSKEEKTDAFCGGDLSCFWQASVWPRRFSTRCCPGKQIRENRNK